MRQININAVQYDIFGEIEKEDINPWKDKLGSEGVAYQYGDFANCLIKEYRDFRNGIGLASERTDRPNRSWWTNGADVTRSEGVVLNPLVTTAGAFGATPVRIFDFNNLTIGVADGKIATGTGGDWTTRETGLSNPIDATVVTDATDEYAIVSSALAVKYSTDGTTWTDGFYASPTGFTDAEASWANEENAYDEDTATYAHESITGPTAWGNYLELTLTTPVKCSRIRYYAGRDNSFINKIDIDVYDADASTWRVAINEDTLTVGSWVTANLAQAYTVSKARIRFYNSVEGSTAYEARLHEFDFGGAPGYMAEYAGKLYFVSTSGNYVTYSAVNDCDTYGGYFNLIGNFGTIYGLFAGKLLTEGTTSTLYMHGTRGLFAIDTENEKAYSQDINYPPYSYAGKAAMYWNGRVFLASGTSLWQVSSSEAIPVGLDRDDGLPSGYQGYISDMTHTPTWLVYAVNGGSSNKSSIFKQNPQVGGNLQVYSTSATDKQITCIHFSPSSLYTNGRLWFGEGTDIKYFMLPDLTSNPKQISTYAYQDDSDYCILPTFRDMAAIQKVALGVKAVTKSCNTDEYVIVYYRTNTNCGNSVDSNWTSLGNYQTSPMATHTFGSSGEGLSFYTIQFAYKLIRGTTNTNSPELESLLFYYLPDLTPVYRWTFYIKSQKEYASTIIDAFEALQDTGTLVTFYPSGDKSKSSYLVKVKSVKEIIHYEQMGMPEGTIQVVVEQVFSG